MENYYFTINLPFTVDTEKLESALKARLSDKAFELLFKSVLKAKDTATLFKVYLSAVNPQAFVDALIEMEIEVGKEPDVNEELDVF
jgi:hypothetical protein